MTVVTVPIFDAKHINIAHLPPGQHGGYVTGTPDVAWTTEDYADDPTALRIDQSPASSTWDSTADVQDYEPLAVTLAELPNRIHGMLTAYREGIRPGQRPPAVYVGARPNATPVVNALVAAGITSGIGLAIAAPGMSSTEAIGLIESTAGTPWPIIWVQNEMDAGGGTYDAGYASKPWLDAVSVKPGPAPKRLALVTLHFTDGTTEEYT